MTVLWPKQQYYGQAQHFWETSGWLASKLFGFYLLSKPTLRSTQSKFNFKWLKQGQNSITLTSHNNSWRLAGGQLVRLLRCINNKLNRSTLLFTPSNSDSKWMRYGQTSNIFASHNISCLSLLAFLPAYSQLESQHLLLFYQAITVIIIPAQWCRGHSLTVFNTCKIKNDLTARGSQNGRRGLTCRFWVLLSTFTK